MCCPAKPCSASPQADTYHVAFGLVGHAVPDQQDYGHVFVLSEIDVLYDAVSDDVARGMRCQWSDVPWKRPRRGMTDPATYLLAL